jgi:hypothetical protein
MSAAEREGLARRRGVDQLATLLGRRQWIDRVFRGEDATR